MIGSCVNYIFFNSYLIIIFCSTSAWQSELNRVSNEKCLIIVDPLNEYGNSETAEKYCDAKGIRLLNMWSRTIANRIIQSRTHDVKINDDDICPLPGIENALNWLKAHSASVTDVCGVLCESDTGLRTAEEFVNDINLATSNGICEGRRDKYIMQELLKKANLEHINQILTDDWQQAESFSRNFLEKGESVILKPCRGAASVGVMKANNLAEAQTYFNQLLGIPGYANGSISDAILIQECIDGCEYAIDSVSRDNEHKIVAVWKYDKRATNTAPFVYHCTELVTEINDEIKSLMSYTFALLDVFNVRWGPAHIEIKMHPVRGPVLIETNIGRWHGQDFCTLCNVCYGFNAVELTVDAYVSSSVR